MNPHQDGASSIGRVRAQRYVKSKRAVFVGLNCIRFLESDSRHIAAMESATAYDRTAQNGRMASRKEIQAIPCLMPDELLLNPVKIRARGRRNGPTRVIVKNGIVCV